MKDLLKTVWIANFTGTDLPRDLDLSDALQEGLVERAGDTYHLTEKGRKMIKIVVAGGAFDILHPGHGFFLEKAKDGGDILVVIVARDSTVERRKRIPVIPEDQRRLMVSYLRPVDVAVLGKENADFLDIIEEIRPDVIALGPDQHHAEQEIRDTLKSRGFDIEVTRVKEYMQCAFHSTRKILEKCMDRGYPIDNGQRKN